MSLKAFHIVFIIASTLLSFGLGVWAIREYSARHEPGLLVAACGAFLGGAGLIGYSRWFLRKLKDVSYL